MGRAEDLSERGIVLGLYVKMLVGGVCIGLNGAYMQEVKNRDFLKLQVYVWQKGSISKEIKKKKKSFKKGR